MATVKAFRIEGLRLWFWSNDHEPPHFHAKRAGEWEVKVHFLLEPAEMIAVVWAVKQVPTKVLKSLADQAEEHRVALLAQWHEVQGC